jgi:hypothetical protein
MLWWFSEGRFCGAKLELKSQEHGGDEYELAAAGG